jgi:hypothetical protein
VKILWFDICHNKIAVIIRALENNVEKEEKKERPCFLNKKLRHAWEQLNECVFEYNAFQVVAS